MALIKCPECGRKGVSDSANSCPQCGFNIKEYYDNTELPKDTSKVDSQNAESNYMIYVCPKCNSVEAASPNKDFKCKFCGTYTIETEFSEAEFDRDESTKEKIAQKYCHTKVPASIKNNSKKEISTHNASTKAVSVSPKSSGGLKIWQLMLIIFFSIFILYSLFGKVSEKSKDPYCHTMECEWCGKVEDTKTYAVAEIDGYNKDGSIKYKHSCVNLSDKCYEKAKKEGIKYGWVSIKEA